MGFLRSVVRRGSALLLGYLLTLVPLWAQTELPALSLSQLNRPSGWQLVGSVTTTPDGTSLKTQSGNSVLLGSSQPLTLVTPTADFRLRFEVLMTRDAGGTLTLPNGMTLSLDHSVELPRLLKAPGLWQTVDVWFTMRNDRGFAVLEKLALNGVTVREGQVLTGKASGPLTIMATNGQLAIRNIGYRSMTPRQVARWSSPVSYTIVEGQYIDNREEARKRKVLKQDTTSAINYEVSYGQPRQYTIFFAGKLNILQPGDYQFELNQGGQGGLWVDGKELIPISHRELGQPSTGNATLTVGPHDVEVYFSRSWFRPGLGLFISQADTRPQPLHAPGSLPEPDAIGVVSVKPAAHPELIRSFVQLPGEKTKRTHSLSVGSPEGLHYTLDLNQMALLQVWKGDFANVTEMWYERGEPQLLSPMGALVRLPPQPGLMLLPDDKTAWPDSVGDNTLQYKGYALDRDGYPASTYRMGNATVTDLIRPEGNALVRTLTVSGSPTGTVYCRVAAGSAIDEVSKGLYAVNDRSYYVRLDPKAKTITRQSGGKQELLVPVSLQNGTGSVQYALVF